MDRLLILVAQTEDAETLKALAESALPGVCADCAGSLGEACEKAEAVCYGAFLLDTNLLKPYNAKTMSALLGGMRRREGGPVQGSVVISSKSGEYRFDADDIVYVETMQKDIEIHTTGGTVTVARRSLKQILALLPPGQFAQCHRSYVFNRRRVQSFQSRGGSSYLEMAGGGRIPVGTKYKPAVRASFCAEKLPIS